MEKINVNDIVRIETMPKVFEQLEMIGKYIDEQVKDIDILECNEDNKNEIKSRRAEINNTLKLLDDKRKEIKNTLLEPYEIFNEKYEKECKGKLLSASEILKSKIDSIEEQQKKEKKEELELFAKEHFTFNNIEDIVNFNDIGLNITLSASMKSLKEQVLKFCEKISNDIKLIELEEYKEEILLEYKNNLDLTKSKLNVLNRHKQLEEIRKKEEEKQLMFDEEDKIVEVVEEVIEEEITAPVEIIEDEDIIEVQFKVRGTKEQIKEIKRLIIELGVDYE